MLRCLSFVLLSGVCLFIAGCSTAQETASLESENSSASANAREGAVQLASAEAEKPAQKPEQAAEATPTFKVKFETTQGDVVIEVHPDWAPRGSERFKELVETGFFNDVAFFRVVNGFMAQFGISDNAEANQKYREISLKDDRVRQSNTRGRVTFAATGAPNSRTTQMFINFGNNARLDKMGFAPVGEVVSGMDVVDKLYDGYGERPSQFQAQIAEQGNAFLKAQYPKLDYIKKATIVEE